MTTSTEIGYLSDTARDYTEALGTVKTLDDLRAFGQRWRELAWDAQAIIQEMDEAGFAEYLHATELERRNRVKGSGREMQERYGAIWMPETLFKVQMVASHFKVPFGVAFLRLRDAGRVCVDDGRCTVNV